MNKSTLPSLLITLCFIAHAFTLVAQSAVLITPKDVDRYYPEQKEFYLEYYDNLSTQNQLDQEKLINEKALISKRKRLRSKDIRAIQSIESELDSLIQQSKLILENTSMWANINYNQDKNEELFLSSNCYDINTTRGIFSPEEYSVDEISVSNSITWSEHVKTYNHISQIDESSNNQKWVKKKPKNCVSSDPDDCLVWCLITCPLEFEYNTDNQICSRHIVVDNIKSTYQKIEVVLLSTNQELIVIDFREIECDN